MMPLSDILEAVVLAMRDAGVQSLLIGGFAVNHYGYVRSTNDIDFMVALDDMDRLVPALKRAGFTNVEHLDNVVFFQRPEHTVRVDVLKVERETLSTMLSRAVEVRYLEQVIMMPLLDDLLAMKLFALKHSWDRRVHKDLPDVANLVVLNAVEISQTLKALCDRFASDEIYATLCREIDLLTGKLAT